MSIFPSITTVIINEIFVSRDEKTMRFIYTNARTKYTKKKFAYYKQ